MKKSYASILLLSIILLCCKKQPAIDNKPDILTTGTWRLAAYMRDDYSGYNDLYTSLPDCRKDDYLRFNKDGTAEINEGPTICNSADPQSRGIRWRFLNSYNSKIEIEGEKYYIMKLDAAEFEIKTASVDPYAVHNSITYCR